MLEATVRRIRPDGPALSLVVERDGARIPVYLDVAGEAKDGEKVFCLMLGITNDRLLMMVLRRADSGGLYTRLGTTGSNRKAPDRKKFISNWNPFQGLIEII